MNKNSTFGLVLVVVGAALILQKVLHFDISLWHFLWPLFLLIPGISMHLNYFSNRNNSGNLFVAAILTTYGLLFLFNAVTADEYSHMLTFVYPLGISIGFFELYAFGDKRNGNFVAGLIFIVFSVYVLLNRFLPDMNNFKDYMVASLFIILGIFVLLKKNK